MKKITVVFPFFFFLYTNICFSQLIQPEDLKYIGAFRLPDGSGGSNWNYSGYAATFYPGGDPVGPNDGFPGSIFAVGHDHQQFVSEIDIPVPVISLNKTLNELNTANTLQEFQDITGGVFGYLEIPRAGLAYLPAQGSQATGKLHFCWGQHFQFDLAPSHGWCELDLTNPRMAGPWYFGNFSNYVTNDYLFDVPKEWADVNTSGQYLATGRFRDGQWGGLGPALFTYSPSTDGNPLAANDTLLNVTPLLLYGIHTPGIPELTVADSMKMKYFSEPDEWAGGAWLTSGNKSAVIFVGTKALGNSWYGFSDGTVWPEEPPYPEVPPFPHDNRGWWSDSIKAQIIFYDPNDLAAVAQGILKPYEPQPYAVLELDNHLFNPGYDFYRYKRYTVGACCFDRERGFLYIFERLADEDKSLVHVWMVEKNTTKVNDKPKIETYKLEQNYPNPFVFDAGHTNVAIQFKIPTRELVKIRIFNVLGHEVHTLPEKQYLSGNHKIQWDGRNNFGRLVRTGIYYYELKAGNFRKVKKLVLIRSDANY